MPECSTVLYAVYSRTALWGDVVAGGVCAVVGTIVVVATIVATIVVATIVV